MHIYWEVEGQHDNSTPTTEDSPLVTFALFTYNQEKYIREALSSALAQEYPNLEIIISDDASGDGTWDLINDLTKSYCGPHRILLNRNKRNLGVTSHVNKVFALSSGELIVMAAGDDISCPTRVRKLVSAWKAQNFSKGMLHSVAQPIDTFGREFREPMKGLLADRDSMSIDFFRENRSKMLVHGATAAYTRDLIEHFGHLESDGLIEDAVLTFRAALSGKLMFVDSVLVQYRISAGSISGQSHSSRSPEKWVRWMSAQELKLKNHLLDYQKFQKSSGQLENLDFCRYLERTASGFSFAKDMVSPSLIKRLRGLWKLPGLGTWRDKLTFAYLFYK